jgi:hypothetical protein
MSDDKGVRLYKYSRWEIMASNRFQFVLEAFSDWMSKEVFGVDAVRHGRRHDELACISVGDSPEQTGFHSITALISPSFHVQ